MQGMKYKLYIQWYDFSYVKRCLNKKTKQYKQTISDYIWVFQ